MLGSTGKHVFSKAKCSKSINLDWYILPRCAHTAYWNI